MDGEEKTTTAGGENQADVQNPETNATQNEVVSEQSEEAAKVQNSGDAPADTQTSEGTE